MADLMFAEWKLQQTSLLVMDQKWPIDLSVNHGPDSVDISESTCNCTVQTILSTHKYVVKKKTKHRTIHFFDAIVESVQGLANQRLDMADLCKA